MDGSEPATTASVLASDVTGHPVDSPVPRPFVPRFYGSVATRARNANARERVVLSEFAGRSVRVAAGELLSIELLEGAQAVCVFPINAHDPDERYWASQTALSEGLFLRRFSRLWGTMARYRPLLTIVDDTLSDRSASIGSHTAIGGWASPAEWAAGGGSRDVPTVWEQLSAAATACGLDPAVVLRDHVSLFQRVEVEGDAQRLRVAPTEAVAGDRVVFLAEIDLDVLLAVHPLIDGLLSPAALGSATPRPVEVRVSHQAVEPLGWPLPGQPSPDLSLYLNEAGVRSSEPVPTPGRESP